jgi:hypothetical protein
MTELTRLEQLEKKVVDTKTDYNDAGANPAASYADYIAAYHVWSKARKNLFDYLEEQDDV